MPGCRSAPPSNLTTDQAAVWANQNTSYVYAGAGLTTKADPSTVIVYEKDANHEYQGMNLLFADGRVEFHNLADAHALIAAHAGGR